MKRLLGLVLILVVLSAGCLGSGSDEGSTTSTSTVAGIDFSQHPTGKVVGAWWKFFNETFYVSDGYADLVKHYFPDAKVEPFSAFEGSGIAVLSPGDAIKSRLLFGKSLQVQELEPFGYIAYKQGTHLPGPWLGVVAVMNSENGSMMVITGTSRAGVGASLYFLKGLKDGTLSVDRNAVVRSKSFEGVLLKELGDVNFNGFPDDDEYYELHQLLFDEPFNYYWRVVKGENVTVSGGFIRLVNGTTIYLRALGFNVTVKIENPKGVPLTYVLENVNPKLMVLPEGTKVVDNTTIKFTTDEPGFSIVAKDVSGYKVLAFGDHRPGSGEKPPEVFLKIMEEINKEDGAFVIDGGDLVYSGTIYQWAELMKVWRWNKPVFIAVGNHEYQGEGVSIFHYYFGPTDYAFSFGGYRYIFANNVDNGYRLTEEQLAWLKEQLEIAKERGERPVIVMHAPPYDPRHSHDHAMDEESAKELLALMGEYNAFGIFSHIHIFWNGTYDGVHFVITGGGGAPLYAKHDEGGFYHYVRLGMGADGNITVEPVEVSE
ncbi:phosphoesterase [Thermococcus eurythermalis]|uniref:Phosphoesterase n=1 Tax=Thermococcus eurythermalis TaxID=1505907 RepID=A0A097QRT2_9EURY|nr:metallophosphoesterase [Thermococcus eurythermalis]AIU69191.1 phosphoesterase [Thermococcus eurythermalis]